MIRQLLARRKSWLTTASLFALILLAAALPARAATVYGVTTTNQLVRFNSATPGTITTVGAITGLQTGENIAGIDFRPANGQLYALGSTSRLYTINLTNGAAAQIGSAGAFTLSGTNFGFDFNPVPDRLRVVSNTGQNLRLNPNDGSLAATDTPLNPGTPNVTAAAYTNSFAGATATTLYVIDTTTDTLYLQGSINGSPNSPNGGVLTAVGALGVDASDTNGFDISSSDGTAYAALTVGGTSGLYTINLTTGAATQVGAFPAGTLVSGIAVAFGSGAVGTAVLDYDGDRRTDFSILRGDDSGNGTFFVRRSSDNGFSVVPFGFSSDIQTPGDYNGDGRTDYAVWRESNGTFYVLTAGTATFQSFQYGQVGDEPVARDYDGDGKTDYAVVRRANGLLIWYVAQSSLNYSSRAQQFGIDSDTVAPGDYDGDGRFDLAVYRGAPSGPATFYVQQSTAGFRAVQFGLGSDLVVPGDYDGDGKYDFAVLRQGTVYTWYILGSVGNTFRSIQFGSKPQLSAQGDYDGDGKTDVATWNPLNGAFYIARSSAPGSVQQVLFGQNGDFPVANFDTH